MDRRSLSPKALRKSAETIEDEEALLKPEDSNELSADASNKLIHELRVHQIELVMQNENLSVANEALAQLQNRYLELYDLSPVGYCTLNSGGLVLQANLTIAGLLGISRDTLQQQLLSNFIVASFQDNFYLFKNDILNSAADHSSVCELQMLRSDMTLCWVNLIGKGTQDDRGEKVLHIALSDNTIHHDDLEEIRRLAFFDPLTGLPNRRLLVDRLDHAMHTANRSGHYAALMFLDLDNFKLLNDSMGHSAGDLLLQQVAARLQEFAHEGASIARLGGDEFVVLLESLSQNKKVAATEAEAVARKILAVLAQEYLLYQQTHTVTSSLGIMMFMDKYVGIEDLFKNADTAMYQAKAAGRNTLRFFDPKMQAVAEARSTLEKDLSRGLGLKEFTLHYQVQINSEGCTTGAEALVRWLHPQRGIVSPAKFIPLAEETQLILPLGQWVLETACAQLMEWSKQPTKAHWSISVNVSALQFAQDDFILNVTHALTKSGAKPSLLKLELTESMLARNVDSIIEKMNAIKKLGVSFSLDDFGSGYSSLSYLKRLPLDQLKIDQSFVKDLLDDLNDAIICKTIVVLGQTLGLSVIAEGVETKAQHDFLLSIGCNAFQGYYFGLPVEASAFE